MCKFFSFVTKGSQKYYFDWPTRVELLKSNPDDYNPDSHSSICHFFKITEDKVNKFEYDPLTGLFQVDQINIKDNRALAKKWVEKLDFKTIVKPLIIKPIIHPFKITPPEITDKHIELLKQWTSVWASVRASFRDSVWDSIGDSVGASVRDSVWASFRDSVGVSVWDSVGDSVRASVRAYTSSFFDIKKWVYIDHKEGENPFQSCIDLWEQGLVPSFNGKIWRLHGGEKSEVLYELKQ